MRNIKSYRLSTQLKAELNYSHKPAASLFSRPFRISWNKIPFKKIAAFTGIFVLIIAGYLGIKQLYELGSKKTAKARAAQQLSYDQHISQIKSEVSSKATDAEGFVTLSEQYLNQKDIERAQQAAQLAVSKNPSWRDAYINLGHVLLVANKFQDAKSAFEKAVAIDPLSGQAHYFLSLTYQELKDNNAAKAEFSKAKQFGFESEIGG